MQTGRFVTPTGIPHTRAVSPSSIIRQTTRLKPTTHQMAAGRRQRRPGLLRRYHLARSQSRPVAGMPRSASPCRRESTQLTQLAEPHDQHPIRARHARPPIHVSGKHAAPTQATILRRPWPDLPAHSSTSTARFLTDDKRRHVLARFNQRSHEEGPDTLNRAGGQAYAESDKLAFLSLLLTSFLDDQYYRSAGIAVAELVDLTRRVDPLFAAKGAVYARREFGMRSVTHVVAGGSRAW